MNRVPQAARRLFFALWPDDATREAVAHATRKAVRASGGRPVAKANLHITLAFLGSVAEDRLPDVLAAGSGLEAAPFELLFDRVAHWARPQVLVALTPEPVAAATRLVAQLWSRLAPLGIPPDLRPYQPHVTLARKVRRPAAELHMRPARWPVADLALVESVTSAAGARYAVLRRWPLDRLAAGSPPDPPAPADSPQR